jgi:hypothetical protein
VRPRGSEPTFWTAKNSQLFAVSDISGTNSLQEALINRFREIINMPPRQLEGKIMSQFDQGRKTTERAAGMARDAANRGEEAIQQSIQAATDNFSMSTSGFREFNLKMIEIARENTMAFFDFASKAMTTTEPNAMMELWQAHTQTQMEMLSKQSKELTTLGQKLATEGTEPLSRNFR